MISDLLLVDLGSLVFFLLGFHLMLDLAHLHLLLESLVVVVFHLLSLEEIRVVALHLILVLTVDSVVRFGFIHNLVQALRQDKLGQVLLVDALLLHLCLSNAIEVPFFVRQDFARGALHYALGPAGAHHGLVEVVEGVPTERQPSSVLLRLRLACLALVV
jgi:hypothetical protein